MEFQVDFFLFQRLLYILKQRTFYWFQIDIWEGGYWILLMGYFGRSSLVEIVFIFSVDEWLPLPWLSPVDQMRIANQLLFGSWTGLDWGWRGLTHLLVCWGSIKYLLSPACPGPGQDKLLLITWQRGFIWPRPVWGQGGRNIENISRRYLGPRLRS